MRIDAGLRVLGEVHIGNRCEAQPLFVGLCKRDTLIDRSTWCLRRLDDGHSAVILLDDNLRALPDFLQHGRKVLGHFSLAHMDLCH